MNYILDVMYQGYSRTVWGLNGVLFGVKLKEGLGTGVLAFDGTFVDEAGGLKF